MNEHHREILEQIKKHAGNGTKHSWSDRYLSSHHFYYSLSNPIKRKIAKEWIIDNKNISAKDLVTLLDSLYWSSSYEEKTIASIIIGCLNKQRNQVAPKNLDRWLDLLQGWAEIDMLCQGNFTAAEFLDNWVVWKGLINKFSKDQNISKRRASLVLLTGPVVHSDDTRLAELSFIVIDRLKAEKDILITKAISWLLRSLVRYHKEEVDKYLKENMDSLPKIAIRETQKKILTGRK